MRRFTLLPVLWASVLLATAVPAAACAYAELREARRQARGGDLPAALDGYQAVVGRHPGTVEAAQAGLALAGFAERDGRLGEADESYRQIACEFAGTRYGWEAVLGLARVAHLTGEAGEAAQHAQRVLEEPPETALAGLARVQLARLQADAGEIGAAAGLIEQAAAESPGAPFVPGALLEAADWMRVAGDEERALEWYGRVMLGFPEDSAVFGAHYGAALCLRERAVAETVGHLEYVAAYAPDRDLIARAFWTLGEVHRSGRRFRQAMWALDRLFQYEWPEFEAYRPRALFAMAGIMAERKRNEEALRYLDRLEREFPDSEQAQSAAELREQIGEPEWIALVDLVNEKAAVTWDGARREAILSFSRRSRAAIWARDSEREERVLVRFRPGWPYAVVQRNWEAIGWSPRLSQGRLLVPRQGVADILRRYGIKTEDVAGTEYRPSEAPPDMWLEQARASAREGGTDGARRLYLQVEESHPGSPQAAEAGLELAELAQRAGDSEGARDRYRGVARKYAGTRFAGQALERMAALVDPGESESPERARLLGAAAEHYAAAGLPEHAELMRARALDEEGHYAGALRVLDGVVDRWPWSEVADTALEWAGYNCLWLGDGASALARFQRLCAEYPESPLFPDAMYYSGFGSEELNGVRAFRWVIVYDPDPERWVRAYVWCRGGFGRDARARGSEIRLGYRRVLAVQPDGAKGWLASTPRYLARSYMNDARHSEAVEVLRSAEAQMEPRWREDAKALLGSLEEELSKERFADLAAWAAEREDADLRWDGHSPDAVLMVGGEEAVMHEDECFARVGRRTVGIRWRPRIEDGRYMVARSGLSRLVNALQGTRP